MCASLIVMADLTGTKIFRLEASRSIVIIMWALVTMPEKRKCICVLRPAEVIRLSAITPKVDLVYTATASTYETAVSLGVFNSRLYIGLGSGDNDADIIMCNPAGGGNISNCDNASDFTQVYSETGSRNTILSMLAFNNHFYAGTAGGASEGDL